MVELPSGLNTVSRAGIISRVAPVLICAALTYAPTLAYADNGKEGTGLDPQAMLVAVCKFILGGFGQTLGVLAIVGIGLAWMFGRVSLGLVAGVIGGIVVMFGAGYLGQTLMGTGAGVLS